MRAIDPAIGADSGLAALSDAEVESLLAGLSPISPQPARALPLVSAGGAVEPALGNFAAALQAQFERASVPLFVESGRPVYTDSLALGGTALSRTIESARPVELICTRELIACMVDYRFGGIGVAAVADMSRPFSVTERRALDRLLDSVAEVWRSNGAMLEEAARNGFSGAPPTPGHSMTIAYSVRAGAGTGILALTFSAGEKPPRSVVAAESEDIMLIASLVQIRLSGDAARSISKGDMIAFTLPQPIEVICMDVKLCCLHGASNGRHALRVLSVSPAAAGPQPTPTPAGEIEYALELGRRILSQQELEAIGAGDIISFDQAVDRPLPLTRDGHRCGYAEVVVLPEGHALRIVEWQP